MTMSTETDSLPQSRIVQGLGLGCAVFLSGLFCTWLAAGEFPRAAWQSYKDFRAGEELLGGMVFFFLLVLAVVTALDVLGIWLAVMMGGGQPPDAAAPGSATDTWRGVGLILSKLMVGLFGTWLIVGEIPQAVWLSFRDSRAGGLLEGYCLTFLLALATVLALDVLGALLAHACLSFQIAASKRWQAAVG